MVVWNGQVESTGTTPIANYFTALVMAFSAVLVRRFLKLGLPVSKFLLVFSSLYFLGVLAVSFFRANLLIELSRSIVTATSVWCGLMVGACIGFEPKAIYRFAKVLLLFGTFISLISIITNVGLVSSISSLSVGRSNRLWTQVFGVVDPVSMVVSAILLIQGKKIRTDRGKILFFGSFFVSVLLLLYSSTRSFLIQTAALIFVLIAAKFKSYLRAILLIWGAFVTIFLLFNLSTVLTWMSSMPILDQFGFVDPSGSITLEKTRVVLSAYLIDTALQNPLVGAGISIVKDGASQVDGAANTEYGYALHIAAFGFIVALPFYLCMVVGGVVQPLLSLATVPKKEIATLSAVNGMAIGAFLAGFNGYYGQATAVTQFTYLIWIGIAISVNQKVLQKNARRNPSMFSLRKTIKSSA